MPDIKKNRNIFHVVEWIAALLTGALFAGILCYGCGDCIETQFIHATIYGYVIVTSLVFLGFLVDEDVPQKMGYGYTAVGAILYLISGILVVDCHYISDSGPSRNRHFHYNDRFDGGGDSDGRTFRYHVGVAFLFLLGIVFLVEFIISLAKPSFLDGAPPE